MRKNEIIVLTATSVLCLGIGIVIGRVWENATNDRPQKVQLVLSEQHEKMHAEKAKRMLTSITKSRLGNLLGALDLYALDVGNFPTAEQGLKVLVEPPNERIAQKWQGPYLSDNEVPLDAWDNHFRYVRPSIDGDPDNATVISAGSDGEFGSDDDLHRSTNETF